MAKDMSKVYAEMLTKELVALRRRHMTTLENLSNVNTHAARAEVERCADLLNQVNNELASRIAAFNLFV